MFSSRVPSNLDSNAVARALSRARAASRPLLDLTASNPTMAGFVYPETLLAPLQSREALTYEPSPFGHKGARAAVAADYAGRGLTISADRIVLTSSTSDAYSLLFKLLCEPAGDSVLVPIPSYPLFEHLTRLDGVCPVPYRLEYHGRWTIDLAGVEAAWTPRTRATLAVAPNNPTGSYLSQAEHDALSDLCASRDAALILDEVFADYPLADARRPLSGRDERRRAGSLTFRLGGLSKSVGLPQVKLGWIAVEGPDAEVGRALERLEYICDAYLSVSTPVQVAAPRLLEEGAGVRRQIHERVRANYDDLREMCARHPAVELLRADAGWSAVLRVPSRASEEELVLELLERDDVVVHPGFFFDFPHEAFLIVSLLPPPEIFREGTSRLLERVA
jgi:alanine-synthesizing transaminase